MALYFHKKPIVLSAKTLKNLVFRFKDYTKSVEYLEANEETYEKCRTATALLESSIRLVKECRKNLENLYNEVRNHYENCNNKSEKKDLVAEIEQIEEESQLHPVIAEANDLIITLTARLDESKCSQARIARKLGYSSNNAIGGGIMSSDDPEYRSGHSKDSDLVNIGLDTEGGSQLRPPHTVQPASSEMRRMPPRSIRPPQVSLPKFHGNAEEFAEFWAIFETLVHNSDELEVIEKILLLRECLEGRARFAIQGIQPLPQNYDWMIQTLQEKYCDYSANRSQIVQKLVLMEPATDKADSCSETYEQIQVLVNQMISSGYDVRTTCDPMWYETIIAKFPRDIVKPVLIRSQAETNQTIKDLLAHLKQEIAAKTYVENRLGSMISNKSDYIFNNKANLSSQRQTTIPRESCIFCYRSNHVSTKCRTVKDPVSRRNILKDENRCWKCFSSDHNSFHCQKRDCSHCGQKHHTSICFQDRNSIASQENHSLTHSNRGVGQQSKRVSNSSHKHQRFFQQKGRRYFSSSTHAESKRKPFKAAEQNCATSQLVFMTTEGDLWNFNKQSYEKVLFFFDSGAQHTVIEEKTAERFGIPRESAKFCTMSGMGGHVETYKTHAITAKVCSALTEEIELKIHTKPRITNGFPSVKLNNIDIRFLKENNIRLANSKLRGEHQIPHILVGLDYYHDLVTSSGHMERTPSGLHVAKTIFGPSLYGKGLLEVENVGSNICYGMTAISEQRIYPKANGPDVKALDSVIPSDRTLGQDKLMLTCSTYSPSQNKKSERKIQQERHTRKRENHRQLIRQESGPGSHNRKRTNVSPLIEAKTFLGERSLLGASMAQPGGLIRLQRNNNRKDPSKLPQFHKVETGHYKETYKKRLRRSVQHSEIICKKVEH